MKVISKDDETLSILFKNTKITVTFPSDLDDEDCFDINITTKDNIYLGSCYLSYYQAAVSCGVGELDAIEHAINTCKKNNLTNKEIIFLLQEIIKLTKELGRVVFVFMSIITKHKMKQFMQYPAHKILNQIPGVKTASQKSVNSHNYIRNYIF